MQAERQRLAKDALLVAIAERLHFPDRARPLRRRAGGVELVRGPGPDGVLEIARAVARPASELRDRERRVLDRAEVQLERAREPRCGDLRRNDVVRGARDRHARAESPQGPRHARWGPWSGELLDQPCPRLDLAVHRQPPESAEQADHLVHGEPWGLLAGV